MKKNILTTLVACILVAALAVGGTLAYMTATDDAVQNTFSFAEDIAVTLTEPKPGKTANETITGDAEKGWNYANVVPGQTLNKAPAVTLAASVDTYFFVKLSGFNATVSLPAGSLNTTDWVLVVDDGNGNGTYCYKNAVVAANTNPGSTIFTTVKIADNATKADVEDTEILIQVAAIQATGFTDAADALAKGKPTFKGIVTPDPAA